jgi:hypothetical protein
MTMLGQDGLENFENKKIVSSSGLKSATFRPVA